MEPLGARTVILEALSRPEAADGMTVQLLLRHAAVFDISESTVRVALVRLRAERLVESVSRGVYRLGPGAQAVQERISGWRDVESEVCAWNGGWIAAHTAALGRTDRRAVRRRERAFRLLGFRELSAGLMLRPANLVLGVSGVRERLYQIGLDPAAPVFLISELDEPTGRAAHALWDGEGLADGYRELRQQLEDSTARLDGLPLEQAVREAFLLGREAIRALVFDPRLPEPLVTASERAALGAAMREYDVLAKQKWLEYLEQQSA